MVLFCNRIFHTTPTIFPLILSSSTTALQYTEVSTIIINKARDDDVGPNNNTYIYGVDGLHTSE